MGLRLTTKKILKRTGRAFGVSDLSDQNIILTNITEQSKDAIQQQGVELQRLNDRIAKLEQQLQILRNGIEHTIELTVATNSITQVPVACGNTRLLQLGNLKLLLLFQDICKKYNLGFYLDFGSLLGAVRHRGNIPWDDDLDVSMIREDYNKLLKILDEEFEGTRLFYVHSEIIRIFYDDTPLQLDVFPTDFYQKPINNEDERKQLSKKLADIHHANIKFDWSKLLTQERVITNLDYTEIESLRKENIGPDVSLASAKKIKPAIYHSIDESTSNNYKPVHDYDWIYPLKTAIFEGKRIPVPNKPEVLLEYYYGNYMEWPGRLRSKHSDIDSRVNIQTIEKVKDIITGKIKLTSKNK